MIRTIILTIVLAFSFNAVAQTANPCENIPDTTKNMTAEQTKTLLSACRAEKTATKVVSNITPENAKTFSEAASGVASAVGTAAKELGIAANDFLDSPAGYVLAAVLLLNYGGTLIGGVLFGLPITLLSLFFLARYIRQYRTGVAEYAYIPVLWGMFSVRRVVKYTTNQFDEGDCFYTLAIGVGYMLGMGILWANLL
jgi:predicted PurR-regulated permease PerM